ncbi:MAG: hypothetical protein Hyperionvirus39_1, partial [Hyperionvirus sp.]
SGGIGGRGSIYDGTDGESGSLILANPVTNQLNVITDTPHLFL